MCMKISPGVGLGLATYSRSIPAKVLSTFNPCLPTYLLTLAAESKVLMRGSNIGFSMSENVACYITVTFESWKHPGE